MNSVRCFILLFSVLLAGSLSAQQEGERLVPLQTNPNAKGNAPAQLKNTTGGFIYQIDTFDISATGQPFIDDFSTNRIKQYDAQPTDAGVTDTTFYYLYLSNVVADDTVAFVDDTTYYIQVNMTDTTYDSIPYTSQMLEVRDMCVFPNTSTFVEVWPAFNFWDTINGGSDTVFFIADFYQDSSLQYIVPPDTSLWLDENVYLNGTYPIDPPTIGVATFDGLDHTGIPYDWSIGSYGEADLLTSVPIDLTGLIDTVYLSFLYQAEGLGNDPQPEDSLVVEFLNGATGEWDWVWSTPGTTQGAFTQVMLPIDSVDYLYRGFQFRFKNYATLSGSVDHWHIDYVYLDDNRDITDVVPPRDVAYIYPENTLLATYQRIPWSHYQADPAAQMLTTLSVDQRNLSTSAALMDSSHIYVFFDGSLEVDLQDPNAPTNAAFQVLTITHEVNSAPNNYFFDPNVADTCASFDVKLSIETSTDFNRWNDTIRFTQEFFNYYAHDDGSAESGYGLIGDGSTLAYRFTNIIPDTLRAISMYFNPIVDDVSNEAFRLRVWAADGPGGAPGTVLYEGFTNYNPIYGEIDGYHEYELSAPLLVSGTYYVGWLQVTGELLNIGFDLNNDNSDKIMFNTSGNWTNTSFDGSLMMRPVFVNDKDYLLSTPEEEVVTLNPQFYPNPTNGVITVDGLDPQITVVAQMFDMSGRMVWSDGQMTNGQIAMHQLEDGVYLLRLLDETTGQTSTSRIILQR